MGLFDGMAQGLRAAGSIFSPQVGQQLEQEHMQGQQQQFARQNLITSQLLKAAESGAVDPKIASSVLGQMGIQLPDGAIGPSPEVRAKMAALKREELKAAYLKSPEAQQFIEKQDDVGLIRDMSRRGLLPPDEALKAMKEAREGNKPIGSGGNFAIPDGKGGYTFQNKPNTTAPHTIDQEYKDPTTGEVKKRTLQWNAERGGYVPAQVFDQPPAQGPQPGAPTANMQGDPRAVMAEISRIQDPAERNAALQAYRGQLAGVGGQQAPQAPQGTPLIKTGPTAQTALGKIGADEAAGRITPTQAEEMRHAANGSVLTPEALASAAARYRIDGTMPPYLGRGTQGPINLAKVMNMAAQQAKEAGDGPEEQRIRQIAAKANGVALNDLTKRESQVSAFEKTFVYNTKLVESLVDKVDPRSNIPILQQWINNGRRALDGDSTDIKNLDIAIKGTSNEFAKIVSGSMGNTVIAEGEIKKAEALLNSAMTPQLLKGALETMRTETHNRMKGFSDQKAELMASFKSIDRRAPLPTGAVIDKGDLQKALDRYK